MAERLPLADGCADAVAARLTVHHWSDVAVGTAHRSVFSRTSAASDDPAVSA
ncbi:hypothetical protein ACFCYX_32985 [Streptomyces populi]|uniref:hypothetical protein n=1 Tax=Streptomyces populi TaxID=2058924 RepID=UPI0019CFF494|nr:hypothetical protein [Streptomyces populi]